MHTNSNYLTRHWKGELPLAVAFWVSFVLVNVMIRLGGVWLERFSNIEDPVTSARLAILIFVVAVFIIYPWQIVGLWRSSNRYSEKPDSGVWGGVVRVLVVLGLFFTAFQVVMMLPAYSDLSKVGFSRDEYADYSLSVTDDGSLIHLQGGLGFGVSDDVRELFSEHDGITGIILDSRGGRIYEGRQLSELILANNLNTYSLVGCFSACGTAFVAGTRRYLAKGANLAFHQYRSAGKNLDSYFDIGSEQARDLGLYRRQGVSEEFVEQIFTATEDDLWYPTTDEMLAANVVHELVDASSVKATDHGEFDASEIEAEIAAISAFAAIKKYNPDTYEQIVNGIIDEARRGGSAIEIQQSVATFIEVIAQSSLPETGDDAMIAFATETVGMLTRLHEIDPILCVKNLFPDRYGSFDLMQHLTLEETMPLLDSLSEVIIGKYEATPPAINVQQAEDVRSSVVEQLGDDLAYLDATNLSGREQYSRSCLAVVRFYDLILAEEPAVAANALRYLFSP